MIRSGTQRLFGSGNSRPIDYFQLSYADKKADTPRKMGKGKQSGKERSAVVVTT
ncbi:MAG: hypothetical protein VX830_11690 [Candidatus Poribacteria bacterium]|nr:hypothetical protein [Candidatus Poribacteria bacterium]